MLHNVKQNVDKYHKILLECDCDKILTTGINNMPNDKGNDAIDKEVLDGDLRLRINQKELDIFIAKAKRSTGKDYQVLIREIVTAFNDGRLRIIPTKDQQDGVLYSTV